jgi:hypothetical protein
MDLINRLRELESKATKGPWEVTCSTGMSGFIRTDNGKGYGLTLPDNDAKFLCESRNALLRLLEALEVAREALQEVTYEGHSQNCQNMKPRRPSYTCYCDYATEALDKITKILEG